LKQREGERERKRERERESEKQRSLTISCSLSPLFGWATAACTTTCWCRAKKSRFHESFLSTAQPIFGGASLSVASGTPSLRASALAAMRDRKTVPRGRELAPCEGFTFGFGSEEQLQFQYPYVLVAIE